jgi:hypothetical protein
VILFENLNIQITAIPTRGVTHRSIVDKNALKSYLEENLIVLPDVDDVDILYDGFVRSFNAACLICSHTLRVNDRYFHVREWVDAELINSARLRQYWFGKLGNDRENDRLKREYRTARNIYTSMKGLMDWMDC